MLDLTKLTTQKVRTLILGARIIYVLPTLNGLALELELQGEQRVSVSFLAVMTQNGPGFNTNIQEL